MTEEVKGPQIYVGVLRTEIDEDILKGQTHFIKECQQCKKEMVINVEDYTGEWVDPDTTEREEEVPEFTHFMCFPCAMKMKAALEADEIGVYFRVPEKAIE